MALLLALDYGAEFVKGHAGKVVLEFRLTLLIGPRASATKSGVVRFRELRR